jgi:hypothetical protein
MLILPLVPSPKLVLPVSIDIDPVEKPTPPTVLPVLMVIEPVLPVPEAAPVESVNEPDVPEVVPPDCSVTAPEVPEVILPDCSATAPDVPVVPTPLWILIPFVDVPAAVCILPVPALPIWISAPDPEF